MKILLATDGSRYSEEAADFISRFDLTPSDELVVLHVVSWVPFMYDEAAYYESFNQLKKRLGPKILDAALDRLKNSRARISTTILDGAPEKYIVDTAQNLGVDLIVMGARGVKGLESAIVGSTTKSVALNSQCNVLIVRPASHLEGENLRVLIAADGSEHSLSAARFTASLPFRGDVEVTVVNLIWSGFSDIPERFAPEIDQSIKNMVADARTAEYRESERIIEQLKGAVAGRFAKLETISRIGDPSVEIMKIADELNAGLIVVGSRGLRGVKGVLGSVSRNLMNHSRCSILIGRA